jgi:hypothetical protein
LGTEREEKTTGERDRSQGHTPGAYGQTRHRIARGCLRVWVVSSSQERREIERKERERGDERGAQYEETK